MFTGIVQGMGSVIAVDARVGLTSFVVALGARRGGALERGASIAIDGVCLTATDIAEDQVRFDAMGETLGRTTLDRLEVGQRVNVERSARVGDEIGGHLVSGHIEETACICEVEVSENNHVVTFEFSRRTLDYLFDKGFVALDGCSLTVVEVDRRLGRFEVHFIPETLAVTTFGFKRVGDRVNLELDPQTRAIVDSVERVLEQRRARGLE